MYRHLFVPLDDSGIAAALMRQALDFAAALGARVSFFHAVADFGATDGGALERSLDPAAYSRHLADAARAVLDPAERAAAAAGLRCDSCWAVSDHPHQAIQTHAEAAGADLIFIASHGRRGVARLMLGSQTARLVAESRLPVLVARAGQD